MNVSPSYLYIQIIIQEDVLQLEVSMHNTILQERADTREVPSPIHTQIICLCKQTLG